MLPRFPRPLPVIATWILVVICSPAAHSQSPVTPGPFQPADDVISAAIRDSAFPGAQIAVVWKGTVVHDTVFGRFTYSPESRPVQPTTRYDLASLTKVVATTTAVMKLYDEGRLSLDDAVSRYVPAFAGGGKGEVTVRHLLTHRSGLPPFRQLWKICPSASAALDTIYTTPLVARPGDTTIYSDLGMIIMGKIVEKITGVSLDAFVAKEFFGPLGMSRTGFRPPPDERGLIAPTEVDSGWRMRLVQGTVHDENAEFLGGVSGHAGLFSTASDLAIFVRMLLNGGTYGGRRYLNEHTVHLFTRRVTGSDRALGWDIKAPAGSSAGNLFSPSSFGHTGFTGTSIWVDPERDLAVILLTNRVYPTRARMKIAAVRPAVHDAVVRSLAEGARGR